MSGTRTVPRLLTQILLAFLACSSTGVTANGAVTLVGVQYQQDNPFPEYLCWYHYGNYPTSCGVAIAGANVHVFLKNTGSSSATINGVTLAGYNLSTILKRNTNQHDSNSIYYYWQDPPQDIFDAGEPVWYRCDPNPIPAGGTARVVVRLRTVPVTNPVSITVSTSAGNVAASVPVNTSDPVLASVGFSPDRTQVYLTWRRNGGAAPTAVKMDDVDVTANAVTVGDPNVNFATTVLTFTSPLANMSYHVYQGVYADGKTATGALRTWVNRFIYGTWGARTIGDNDTAGVKAWIDSCNNRGVNAVIMNNNSGGLADFMGTAEGKSYMEAKDYGYVKDSSAWGTNPRMWFIDDEPDIEEGNVQCGTGLVVPCGGGHMTGILGLHLLEYGETLRAKNPSVPTTINLDGNFKPDGWYAYGQLADVMMVDSYYEQEYAGNHWYNPQRDPLYTKPTSIYATAIATATAAEPNPMHMILYSCEYKDTSLGSIWPFPTPASKRVQAYYALAGGAKGMAYWWFKSGYPFNGLDDWGTEAQALWKEIGLIGDEIKTLQPQLVTSHPVTLPLTPGPNVWARALVSGTDTMILIAVNDTVFMDTAGGCQYTAVSNATITCTLPSWMRSPTLSAFEVAAGGITEIGLQTNGNQTQADLGTLKLTKMIVLTTNPQLWTTVAQRYDQLVRPGVDTFAPELFTPIAPTISRHPSNQTPLPGATTSFSVVATGSWPRSYRWQKNQVDLSDGGHYSGCTTPTLVIANSSSNDAANYRCVVTNSAGTATSNAAALTLGAPVGPTITQHPSSQNISVGDAATFTVAAAGSDPLTYQWQKNRVNLISGGHYSGVTTATLSISNADSNDSASYRCVVANGQGTATSNEATLTLCTPPVLVNGDFEGGNTGGVATGWIGYLRATNPTTVWTIQTANPPTTDSLQYQQIANTSSTGGGGVRQDVTGCTAGATYTISGWMRTNSASATCTVKCSPTASTTWSTAIDLTPSQTTTSNSWVPFSGTVVATSSTMTIWLDGQTGGSGLNKTACFDSVRIAGCSSTCIPPTVTQHPTAVSVCPGATASFTIVASGSGPLSYQWQKNQLNLTNIGHYSGVTTATLAIAGADSSDAADYRCVVTAECGSVTSSQAALTVGSPPIPGDFDHDGNVGIGDFDLFAACVKGAGVTLSPGCEDRDLDADTDVDQSDFGIFQRCYSGETIPADPNCAN